MPGTPLKLACIGAVAVLLLAGCRSNPPSEVASNYTSDTGTAQATSSEPTTPPNLTNLSLAVSDMPTGWTGTTDKVAVSLGQAGCLKTASMRAKTKTAHDATFAGPGGAPVFAESLAYFPQSSIATSYDAGLKALRNCKTVEIKSGKVTFKGPLAVTSAPTVGDASEAFTLTARAGSHTLTEYIVIARLRTVLFLTTYASVKSPTVTTFLYLTSKAAAKIAS